MTSRWTDQDEILIRNKVNQSIRTFDRNNEGKDEIIGERRKLWIEDVIKRIIKERFGHLIEDLYEKIKGFFD